MGLFGRKIIKTELQKKAERLPRTKEVQFEAMPLSEAEEAVGKNVSAVLDFVPVNYYAEKLRFLQCTLYFAEDFSEIYLNLQSVANDRVIASGEFYVIDRALLQQILRKFGQYIDIIG